MYLKLSKRSSFHQLRRSKLNFKLECHRKAYARTPGIRGVRACRFSEFASLVTKQGKCILI